MTVYIAIESHNDNKASYLQNYSKIHRVMIDRFDKPVRWYRDISPSSVKRLEKLALSLKIIGEWGTPFTYTKAYIKAHE